MVDPGDFNGGHQVVGCEVVKQERGGPGLERLPGLIEIGHFHFNSGRWPDIGKCRRNGVSEAPACLTYCGDVVVLDQHARR